MIRESIEITEFGEWNKKVLNIYWFMILIVSLTEVVLFLINWRQKGYADYAYFKRNVIRPIAFYVSILVVINLIYNRLKGRHEEKVKYLIVVCSTLVACSIVYFHFAVNVIYVLFIFPIFLSELYRNRRLALFAAILNLICYLLTVFLYLPTKPKGSYHHTIYEIITMLALIISSSIIVMSFINRAKEIIECFIRVQQSEKELAMKNFIMEFNSKMEPATGLYNHKTFYEYLDHLIRQSENYRFPLSLAVLDIDNFKRVNDTYGHSLGDEVIKALSQIIKEYIDADDYAARYGGEEFAIIFTARDKIKAYETSEKIREAFNKVVIEEMKGESFGVSIGISEHAYGMSRQTFFSNADNALYKAKGSSKNKTIIYSN